MFSPALTIRVFGVYLMLLSAGFLFAPDLVLAPLRMPAPADVWIRVAGMLIGFLGFYYLRAAAAGLAQFFAWTVPVRLSIPVFFCAFVGFGLAPPVLLLVALFDAAGGVWTWLALRRLKHTSERAQGEPLSPSV